MAKDDYFVLVYRILTYLYYCLKEGIKPDMEYLTYNTKYFPICESYWKYIIENMFADGYISGVAVGKGLNRGVGKIKVIDMKITPRGIEYLEDNSNMQKAKEFLKSIKEIVAFI